MPTLGHLGWCNVITGRLGVCVSPRGDMLLTKEALPSTLASSVLWDQMLAERRSHTPRTRSNGREERVCREGYRHGDGAGRFSENPPGADTPGERTRLENPA